MGRLDELIEDAPLIFDAFWAVQTGVFPWVEDEVYWYLFLQSVHAPIWCQEKTDSQSLTAIFLVLHISRIQPKWFISFL
jgi:hypothetical protein